jgi:hypothetical protein
LAKVALETARYTRSQGENRIRFQIPLDMRPHRARRGSRRRIIRLCYSQYRTASPHPKTTCDGNLTKPVRRQPLRADLLTAVLIAASLIQT